MGDVLAYVGAGLTALWGMSHAIPTRAVVRGFGAISVDNRRVITQEWVLEALTMWFIAGLVILVTVLGGSGHAMTAWTYRASAAMLLAAGAVTTLTGARTPVVWFKICPVLLTTVAVLLLVASFL